MSSHRTRRQGKQGTEPNKVRKKKLPTFEELVVDGAVPRVKVAIFPSKNKTNNKPAEHVIVELQCEV